MMLPKLQLKFKYVRTTYLRYGFSIICGGVHGMALSTAAEQKSIVGFAIIIVSFILMQWVVFRLARLQAKANFSDSFVQKVIKDTDAIEQYKQVFGQME